MSKTLEEILKRVNANIDLEYALPTGDELTLRKNYVNQSIDEATDRVVLSEFKREYLGNVSTATTVPMPDNFRELQEHPRLWSGGSWTTYEEIEAEEKYEYDSGDRYCYVMGDASNGYNLIFNNPTANATLSVIYQKVATELTTLTDKSEIPSVGFIIKSVEAKVLYGRNSEKYNVADSEAERKFLDYVSRSSKSSGGQGKLTKSTFKNPLS